MAENKEKINSLRTEIAMDEISLKELILKIKEWYEYLLGKWKAILISSLLGGLLGLTYAFIKKPVYTAETTFVLEEGEKSGGLGQYAGIASMVGLDLGGGNGGVFQGDNILELYKSRRMIQETLLSKDTFNQKQQYLIDRYIEYNNLKEKWKNKDYLNNITFDDNFSNYNRTQDSIMGNIVEEINKNCLEVIKPDKKLSIINVKFKSKDELFAKSFTNNIVAKVNQFYIETKTKKSAENLSILKQQADSVKLVLNYSLVGVATALDANPNSNPAFQTLRVPSQKRQVDVQASGAVYQEIIKNLEMAKITFRREKPLIQVIDEPILPLSIDKPNKTICILIGIIIFNFIFSIFTIIRKVKESLNL